MTEALGEGQKVLGQKGRPNELTELRVRGTHSQSNLTITVLVGPEAGGGARRGAEAPRHHGTMGKWAPGQRAVATALRDQVMLCGTKLWAMIPLIGTDRVTPL